MSELPNKAYLSPRTVAKFHDISVKTLYRWINEEKIRAYRIGKSRILRIKREDAEELAQPVDD